VTKRVTEQNSQAEIATTETSRGTHNTGTNEQAASSLIFLSWVIVFYHIWIEGEIASQKTSTQTFSLCLLVNIEVLSEFFTGKSSLEKRWSVNKIS
jgi:hypothetical protein